jgi:hypothetical protein
MNKNIEINPSKPTTPIPSITSWARLVMFAERF